MRTLKQEVCRATLVATTAATCKTTHKKRELIARVFKPLAWIYLVSDNNN